MELVERYIYAVVKHLPGKTRKDIENELRSLIMDALDERSQGKEPSEADVMEVLKELGAPSRVARNYYKEGSYLIGPRFYELFLLLLKIALGAAALGLTVAYIVEAVKNGFEALDLVRLVGQLFSALLSTVGFLTLAFAITERMNPDFERKALDPENNWSPKVLPAVPKRFESVKTSELIVGLLFTGIFFIILNFYPKTFGFYNAEGREFVTLIQLDTLSRYLPLLNILLGVGFIKLLMLLADGKYKVYTFVLEIIGTAGLIVLGVMMLSGPTLVDVSGVMEVEVQNTLFRVLNGVYRGILIVTVIVGLFELGRHGYRFIKTMNESSESRGRFS